MNKSFERELQSLENAKESAKALAEKKKKELLDQKGEEMIEENERQSNKLKEINQMSELEKGITNTLLERHSAEVENLATIQQEADELNEIVEKETNNIIES